MHDRTNYGEHIKWCKERALAELEQQGPGVAIASMVSDLTAFEGSLSPVHHVALSSIIFNDKTPETVRHWIEGF